MYLAGQLGINLCPANAVTTRFYDGTTTGSTPLITSGPTWSSTRGAFMVNNRLFCGMSDGNLSSATFDGVNVSAAAPLAA